MEKQSVSTGESPSIIIMASGNLALKGWGELEVVAKSSSSGDLTVAKSDDQVTIDCRGDCTVNVPFGASVQIKKVSGNAAIKALEGNLSIDEVSGNLALRNVGPAYIHAVHGDLAAKHVGGEFKVDDVKGNASVRDVQGSFIVDNSIQGNLKLVEVEASATAQVKGNATLRLDPQPGERIEITASGNILCRLPEDLSATLHILKANDIKVKLADTNISENRATPFELTFGDGDASLTFSAGGNVFITGQVPDWEMAEDFDTDFRFGFEGKMENIGQQISQQIEARMEMMEKQLEAQMMNLSMAAKTIGLSPDEAERISQRAREASARATARAQEKMKRAQEKIQRQLEAAQRRAEQRARSAERRTQDSGKRTWGFEWPASAPEPTSEPVSDDERLLILKMLEEKKITAEEAEKLLAAMEGQED